MNENVLSPVRYVSQHLPVVPHSQYATTMQTAAASIPTSIDLGSAFSLNITVANSANVITANGADVLHYSLSTSGSASGSFLNQSDAALGGSNVHSIALNTSTIGMQSATVTVTSTNQAIPIATINLSLSFLVVLPGDYNSNGAVDAADYVVWRSNLGLGSGA